jgi:hypothetical protein
MHSHTNIFAVIFATYIFQIMLIQGNSFVKAKTRVGRPKLGKWLRPEMKGKKPRYYREMYAYSPSFVGEQDNIGQELALEL